MDDARSLIHDAKTHLEENDGELVYWGEAIAPTRPAATLPLNGGGSKAERLDKLFKDTIGDCHRCPLGDTRKKIVFGVGNPDAQVMFVGEGPGFEEDRKGEPFVGKAGQLLDKIMASIGLDRNNSYIANIVKCHPMADPADPEKRGNDRAPLPSEVEECLPFLKEQIRIIRPKVIVTLGSPSSRTLLSTIDGITRLRGKVVPITFFEDGAPIPVLPTYHPAALLRNPELKKDVWEDMKKLREMLK